MVYLHFFGFSKESRLTYRQEVNPSLSDEASSRQTVAVGCSLLRSALGGYRPNFF